MGRILTNHGAGTLSAVVILCFAGAAGGAQAQTADAAPQTGAGQGAKITGAGSGSSGGPSAATTVDPSNGGVAGTGLGKMAPRGNAAGTGQSVQGPAGQGTTMSNSTDIRPKP